MDLAGFVVGLPKVELHVHLVGSASPDAVSELAARSPGLGVPEDVERLRALFEFRDFLHFLDVYGLVGRLVRRAEDFASLATSLAKSLAGQNVRYAEVTVTPLMHLKYGVAPQVVREGLDVGTQLARAQYGVDLRWCYDIPVRHDAEAGRQTARIALAHPPAELVSFGLGGAEVGHPRSLFRAAFHMATAAGLRSVPHAGEVVGPEHVWQAIDDLRADRIGHGIRAADDPRLLDRLVSSNIALEVCPTSNVRTRAVASVAQHPLRILLDAGVAVTLNSDDPTMFGTTLTTEYLVAGRDLGLSRLELARVAANGVRASFLDDDRKGQLLSEIQAYVEGAAQRTGPVEEHLV